MSPPAPRLRVVRDPDDLSPGDDFNARATWGDVLRPHGWTRVRASASGEELWCRPGKRGAVSARADRDGDGRLMVFTTSTALPGGESCSLFGAFAVLNHGGDYKAAARTLAAQGYGGAPGDTPSRRPGGRGEASDGRGRAQRPTDRPEPPPAPVAPRPWALPAAVSDWPGSWRELYEERAGIMEHDGGLSREAAERQAEARVRAEYARRQG